MNKTTNTVLAIVVLLTASVLVAQEPALVELEPAAVELEIFEGLIVELDVDLKEFVVKNHDAEMGFRYSDETEVIGAEEGLGVLPETGESLVRVHFRAEPDANTAVRIEILQPAI